MPAGKGYARPYNRSQKKAVKLIGKSADAHASMVARKFANTTRTARKSKRGK